MKVYVLEENYDYEPGLILGVYSDVDSAKAAGEKRLAACYCYDKRFEIPNWSDGMVIRRPMESLAISITEFEVQ